MKLVWEDSPAAAGTSPSDHVWDSNTDCFDAPCECQHHPSLGKHKEFVRRHPAGRSRDGLLVLSLERKSDLEAERVIKLPWKTSRC